MPCLGQLTLQQIPILHILHFSLTAGATNVTLCTIHAGMLDYNCKFTTIHLGVDAAPGGGKTVSVTISDGTESITVSVTGAELCNRADGLINYDAATEDFTIKYSETAGGASTACTLTIRRWYT